MARQDSTAETAEFPSARPGRKIDHSRDAVILDATLELLAEVDFTKLTMAMVATRAKAGKGTVYRRWKSKEELVLDAIGRMKESALDLEQLPDTGTLRGDLLALYLPGPEGAAEQQVKIIAGLTSLLSVNQAFVDATHAALIEPWAAAHLAYLRRSVDRGEIPREVNIEVLSELVARLAAYRTIIERKPFTEQFLASTVDDILLPALHYTEPSKTLSRND
jgi:AcrR family transcriptional regulator